MPDSEDPSAQHLDAGMRRILTDFESEMEPLRALRQEMAELRGKGEAAGGQVTVEVTAAGVLTGVDFGPRALRLDRQALAAAILEASGKAVEDATTRLAELMGEGMAPFIEEADRFLDGLA
ncbi:YbaB/EbfC family nucleoid-associated protein [Actinoallomurus soli]|uniref:YbaB/EbfC family nucleoid-associated protein n=1 Tax=Actinoallomurus soli TaxID=2952535 RepID=UPI002092CD91|nr:YbaB/EbfC family nucleoid-associated protein [Actinoallomurus soli]MCO5968794.1 YbaB/EbfC family nucleoid-associated protein [Actinoallomurus soli]